MAELLRFRHWFVEVEIAGLKRQAQTHLRTARSFAAAHLRMQRMNKIGRDKFSKLTAGFAAIASERVSEALDATTA